MLRREEILKAVENGIDEASTRWDKIFDDPNDVESHTLLGKMRRNEQFYSSFVAENLRQAMNKKNEVDFVTHETRHFVVERAIRKFKKNESKEDYGKVYDLVLWKNNNKPYAVIEVKKSLRQTNLQKDAEKICTLLRVAGTCVGGSIKNGFITFPFRGRKLITSQNEFLKIKCNLEKLLREKGLLNEGKKLGVIKLANGRERRSGAIRISSRMVNN